MVKRLFIVLALMAYGLTSAWAVDVSEKEALKLAEKFVSSLKGSKSAPTVKSAGTVKGSGLYVFNVSDNGGYVIVSNDDQATPILGFSHQGSLDPDNMPDNMRAWLQGYADEIAWLKENGSNVKPASSDSKVRMRAGGTKQAIGKLVQTTWNQGAPYHNMTPYYKVENGQYVYSTENTNNSYTHCATGCVATAMAQVMYYHKCPTQTTVIPQYTWENAGVTLPSLEVTTFDWDNMLTNYEEKKNNQTTILGNSDEQAAIATLMKYCGYALKMNYGPESGAYTSDVAYALKQYFGYNSSTTQVAVRSLYSYDKWVDLIYYELANGRPVVYGGQSSGGGHEFVCDGYEYRDGTDYFHINWGWGGTSDQYFVLSALDPNVQGIGGSSSMDGFRYDQDAVIGIQTSSKNDPMSGITPNIINLTINGMTLSHSSVVVRTEVTATINITNNNADDFDGTIYLGYKSGNSYYLLEGDNFSIRARETKDCQVKFKPTGTGTYNLYVFLPNTQGSYTTDGTLFASLPVVSSGQGIPTNLAVADVSSNSAQLSWTNEGSSSTWKVGYKVDGNTDFTEVDAAMNPFTLTNLSPETQYTVKVRPADLAEAWSPEFTFTTIAAFPVPENVTVSEVMPTSAKISWTGNAQSYDLRYAALSEGVAQESKWLQYDNGNCVGGWGDAASTTWTWGVMYPGSQVTGSKLTKVQFYKRTEGTATVTIKIYCGGDDGPSTQQVGSTINVTPQDATGFQTVTFTNPISITPRQNLWITLTETGIYPMALCSSTEPNNRWFFYGNSWTNNSSSLDGYGWMIRGYIEAESLDGISNWQEVNSLTVQSYSLTNLDTDKNYVAQVRSNYGSDQHSSWVTVPITKALELTNNGTNNETLITAWHGSTTNVTLKGRTLYKDGKWNTLCLPFSLSAEQLAASQLAGADIRTLSTASLDNSNGELQLNFTDSQNSITAGTPYMIKWTKAEGYEEADPQTRDLKDPVFEGVMINKTMNDITSSNVTFKGTYTPLSFNSTNELFLFIGDNNTLFYPQSGASLGACRAYFELGQAVNGVRAFVPNLGGEEKSAGIVSVEVEPFTDGSAPWYTLDGRRLNGQPTQKGVYVRNGKKVVIK